MIDLHAHILPGIDDGPRTLEDAIEMARVARADGIAAIAATSHAGDRSFGWTREQYEAALASVRAVLSEAEIDLEIIPGCEALIDPALPAEVGKGQVRTLNDGRFLLLELPFLQYPSYVERVVFDLQLAGVMPVLAHAERYRAIQEDPNRLIPLIERGVLVQVTAASVLGDFGERPRETAEILATHNLLHLLASDAHDARRRAPAMSEAARRLASWTSEDFADEATRRVPEAIVASRPMPLRTPRQYKRRRGWLNWR